MEEAKYRIKNLQKEKDHEITIVKQEIEGIENIKAKRLQWLRSYDEDAYKATMWLRQNKNMFHGEIYEPMAIEVYFITFVSNIN